MEVDKQPEMESNGAPDDYLSQDRHMGSSHGMNRPLVYVISLFIEDAYGGTSPPPISKLHTLLRMHTMVQKHTHTTLHEIAAWRQ